tara:strand:+ start:68 stop:235 length:168 start_codon:yes stop_codon:yes gene_type:complete
MTEKLGEIFLLIVGVVCITLAMPDMVYYAPPMTVIIYTVGILSVLYGVKRLIVRR